MQYSAPLNEKIEHYIKLGAYKGDIESINAELRQRRLNFEGRPFPFSLEPNTIPQEEAAEAARDLLHVRSALNKLIFAYRNEVSDPSKSGRLREAFKDFDRWASLIVMERRRLPEVMLMRYDLARNKDGNLQVMENNTCCPGGVINNAIVKEAWYSTEIAQAYRSSVKPQKMPIDDPTSFLRYLFSLGSSVAICNFNNVYTNELDLILDEFSRHQKSEFRSNQLVVCDIRDISSNGSTITARGTPVSLIYNKIDATMLDISDAEISGWVEAGKSDTCDYLNSVGAMFIAESKSSLAVLQMTEICSDIGLTQAEMEAITARVPATLLVDCNITSTVRSTIASDKDTWVLKPNYESRGVGVTIGSETSTRDWAQELEGLIATGGVAQHKLALDHRNTRLPNAVVPLPEVRTEYFGVDMFFWGDQFAGAVGRAHSSMVFNVGNGGVAMPTIIV